jgi:DNA ligase (NAD+)
MKNAVDRSKALLKISIKDIESKKEAREHAEELRQLISYHDMQYYVYDDPVIADKEYDQLYDLLEAIEEEWPDLKTDTSPTQRVGSELSGEFPEVKHLTPMLSLDNSYEEKELRQFDERVREKVGQKEIPYTVEPKLDGSGVSLVYEDDMYQRGSTRGDGQRGEDITSNLKTLNTVPLRAGFSGRGIARVEVRGEVLISKKDFKKLNKDRESDGKSPFANARNAAAGSLRLKDPSIVASRRLEFLAYQISLAEDEDGKDLLGEKLEHHDECMQLLHQLGFKTPAEELEPVEGIEKVIERCNHWEEKRDDFPYEIDGAVVKVNKIGWYEKLGLTSHHPRWAMAYKFEARQGTTTILDVEFQVGRTGAITPVAKLEPVEISGVTIQSASLHNEDFIESKNLHYGDKVLVERAGDVIPYVVKRIGEDARGKKKITFPDKCPSCGSELERPEGEAIWRCLNVNCPAQLRERLVHFVSKSALDIDGLGEETIKLFYEKEIIRSLPDLFHIDYEKVRQLEGFAEKSVENLKKAIEKAKDRPLYRLINGLSIRYVGAQTARILADAVECLSDFFKWEKEYFQELEDIGPQMADSIHAFFERKENRDTIEQLEEAGVKVCEEKSRKKKSGPWEDKRFVFTGGLEHFTRQEAKDIVERLGGKAVSAISSKVDYLVVGEDPGSKLEEARKENNIELLDEKQFLDMIPQDEL